MDDNEIDDNNNNHEESLQSIETRINGMQLCDIGHIPEDELIRMHEVMHRHWLVDSEREAKMFNITSWAMEEFGFVTTECSTHALRRLTPPQIDSAYNIRCMPIIRLYIAMKAVGLAGNANDTTISVAQSFSRMMEIVYTMRDNLHSVSHAAAAVSGTEMQTESPLIRRFMSVPPQPEIKEHPTLILFLLDQLYRLGYRRYGLSCYEAIKTPDTGYATHAWKHVCLIEDFVSRAVDKEVNFHIWLMSVNIHNEKRSCSQYLETCSDAEFKPLYPERTLFAFRQGCYDVRDHKFYYHHEHLLHSDRVACKYIDADFPVHLMDETIDWYHDIPTPNFQHIFEYQHLPEDVIRWVFALLGRLFYKLRDLDDWEICPFFKGVAGTGKSTIAKIMRSFYDTQDVAVLSSNCETKFSLQSIYDKFLFMCLEVKKDFALPQCELQSMISGEDVSIAIKNKGAITTQWTVPGLLCGNEIVDRWIDASNSLCRRLLVVEFPRTVREMDPGLEKRIRLELPSIMLKLNMAYHSVVRNYGARDLWAVLPAYFKQTQRDLKGLINALEAFVSNAENEGLSIGPDKYILYTLFRDKFITFCKQNNYPPQKFTTDYCRTIFEEHGFREASATKEWDGKMQHRRYVFGIGLGG